MVRKKDLRACGFYASMTSSVGNVTDIDSGKVSGKPAGKEGRLRTELYADGVKYRLKLHADSVIYRPELPADGVTYPLELYADGMKYRLELHADSVTYRLERMGFPEQR